MDLLFLTMRLFLALVFVVSSVAKFRDQRDSQTALRDFGMPAPVARVVGVALPLVEVLIALLLISGTTAWWGAIGALLLLLVFTGAIGYQLLRGRRPECRCFGALDTGPIGPGTLIRNGVLGMVALAITFRSWGETQSTWSDVFAQTSAVLLLVLILGLSTFCLMVGNLWITFGTYQRLSRRVGDLAAEISVTKARQQRRQMGEVVPPSVGEPAPILELPDLQGNLVDLATLRGRALLLVFVRPGCWACHALVPMLLEWDVSELSKDLQLVIVSRGTADDNRDLAGVQAPVLLSPNAAIAQAFGVGGTPAGLYLDEDGSVASDVVIGIGPVRALLSPATEVAPKETAQPSFHGIWRRAIATPVQRVLTMRRDASA